MQFFQEEDMKGFLDVFFRNVKSDICHTIIR